MLKDEEKAAKALIYYFTNLTKKLKLIVITCNDTVNSVKHPNSIGKIKGFYKDDPSIEFKRITINKLLKIIKEQLTKLNCGNKIGALIMDFSKFLTL